MSNGLSRPPRAKLQVSNETLRRGVQELTTALTRYGGHLATCAEAERTEADCPCGWSEVHERISRRGV